MPQSEVDTPLSQTGGAEGPQTGGGGGAGVPQTVGGGGGGGAGVPQTGGAEEPQSILQMSILTSLVTSLLKIIMCVLKATSGPIQSLN